MPKKLHDCVNKVKAKRVQGNAWAICNASINRKTKPAKKKGK